MKRGAGRARQTHFHVLPQLPKSLYAAAVEPLRQKPQRPAPKNGLTDEALSHMRWEREVNHMSVKQLAAKYGVAVAAAERLLGYINRRHVVPSAPPGCTPKSMPPSGGCWRSKSDRNYAIYAAFNGRNYGELAREFSLSEGSIRNIVTKVRRVISEKGGAA